MIALPEDSDGCPLRRLIPDRAASPGGCKAGDRRRVASVDRAMIPPAGSTSAAGNRAIGREQTRAAAKDRQAAIRAGKKGQGDDALSEKERGAEEDAERAEQFLQDRQPVWKAENHEQHPRGKEPRFLVEGHPI